MKEMGSSCYLSCFCELRIFSVLYTNTNKIKSRAKDDEKSNFSIK